MEPSCGLWFPPGNTCAEGKEEDVFTRWRRRISFWGETRITLIELGGGWGLMVDGSVPGTRSWFLGRFGFWGGDG
jgi:hypothetical protein